MDTVIIGAQIRVENPSKELVEWCCRELTLTNPEYDKKLRMGFWVGNTPKTISLYEVDRNTLVLPYGTLKDILPFVANTHTVRSAFSRWPHVDYGGEDMDLYDYQEKAVDALIDAKYGILQSPAGSGKTQMGIELIKRYQLPALWLTHTADLLTQSKQRAEQYIDKDLIGTITAGKVNIGKGVTFATVQTMANLDLDHYRNKWPLVIVDECHHCCGTPTMVTRFSRVLNHLGAPYKYGLSATVHRADGLIKSVFALLGDVVHAVPDSATVGRIVKVRVEPIGTGIQLTEDCLKADGTLDYAGMINVLCNDMDRNRLIVSTLKSYRDKPALVLSERLDHLSLLMDLLPEEMRLNACMVSGKTKKLERDLSMEDMRTGRKQYMFATYALAREGLDIPRLEALYMATPAKDEAVVIQSIGRIARACKGKNEPVVCDFVDAIRYCQRAYKQRLRHYRQLGAYFGEE